ncbi:hypothetical protein P7H17_05350 [Paenibacillus larvae]|uniref:hypothetical protein n=1 Tax=Paenibacillus larvae TaxID=1464 RepID=UPI001314DDBF|nr:hypothetical protein [Paenibacillus larvae]MDT2241409.1 hypothetical protein [Paenibacillus larvae]MDT2254373.1 hypothetical protein [Paenibacillus larvae]MDT2261450.1 hypothetical protein [Paenibacillus larvae]MDT2277494.1 hypothetical protein [Paenibacillus larvae]MDT2285635.1 hypothetical protein [Paenibacillus larvae]
MSKKERLRLVGRKFIELARLRYGENTITPNRARILAKEVGLNEDLALLAVYEAQKV